VRGRSNSIVSWGVAAGRHPAMRRPHGCGLSHGRVQLPRADVLLGTVLESWCVVSAPRSDAERAARPWPWRSSSRSPPRSSSVPSARGRRRALRTGRQPARRHHPVRARPERSSATVRIAGAVRDEKGQPIAAARVCAAEVSQTAASPARCVAATAGHFAIPSLPAGALSGLGRAAGRVPTAVPRRAAERVPGRASNRGDRLGQGTRPTTSISSSPPGGVALSARCTT